MTSSPHRSGTHISAIRISAPPAASATLPAVSGAHEHSQARGQTQARVQFHDDVQFLDEEAKSGVVVACETSHPGGVIAPLVRGLTDLKLEVHKIESKLSDGVRSERLWVSSPDGAPLSQRRQGLLRTAVFQALESVNDPTPDLSELTA